MPSKFIIEGILDSIKCWNCGGNYIGRADEVMNEGNLGPFWWNGSTWVLCSNWGINVDGYGGYVWIRIENSTSPSIEDL